MNPDAAQTAAAGGGRDFVVFQCPCCDRVVHLLRAIVTVPDPGADPRDVEAVISEPDLDYVRAGYDLHVRDCQR